MRYSQLRDFFRFDTEKRHIMSVLFVAYTLFASFGALINPWSLPDPYNTIMAMLIGYGSLLTGFDDFGLGLYLKNYRNYDPLWNVLLPPILVALTWQYLLTCTIAYLRKQYATRIRGDLNAIK
jgi:hypothetical protein